jgi:hypothetical protein
MQLSAPILAVHRLAQTFQHSGIGGARWVHPLVVSLVHRYDQSQVLVVRKHKIFIIKLKAQDVRFERAKRRVKVSPTSDSRNTEVHQLRADRMLARQVS